MKTMIYSVLLLMQLALVGCAEKYPTNFTNNLPFGLSFYLSKEQVDSIMNAQTNGSKLSNGIENNYIYHFNRQQGIDFDVELRFENDSLYLININHYSPESDNDENYDMAISFFKEQKINLPSYKHTETVYGNDEWSKQGHSIELNSSMFGIIFKDDKLSERVISSRIHSIKHMDKDQYCNSIINQDLGIYKATITDANILVIGVSPIGEPNFDTFAESYLRDATSNGVRVDGCVIVDINNSKWQKGAVIGDRIGRAYK